MTPRRIIEGRMLMLLLSVVVFVAISLAGNSFGHNAVVVDADNADGVLKQLCTSIALKLEPIDEVKRAEVAEACFRWAVIEMYPKQFKHDHS
jgi:proteasome assembly chaperone (PAC2) family protein